MRDILRATLEMAVLTMFIGTVILYLATAIG